MEGNWKIVGKSSDVMKCNSTNIHVEVKFSTLKSNQNI